MYKNDPFLYRYAYGSFSCGSRFWSYPVLCIIHNPGYIFISMHIALYYLNTDTGSYYCIRMVLSSLQGSDNNTGLYIT